MKARLEILEILVISLVLYIMGFVCLYSNTVSAIALLGLAFSFTVLALPPASARLDALGNRKLDLYSRKWKIGEASLLVTFAVLGAASYFTISREYTFLLPFASVRSLPSVIDFQYFLLPMIAPILIIAAIISIAQQYIRKAVTYTLNNDLGQYPKVLQRHKAARRAFHGAFISYLAFLIISGVLLYPDFAFPDLAKQILLQGASISTTFGVFLIEYSFTFDVRLNLWQEATFGLDYLSSARALDSVSFMLKEIVENLHALYLHYWRFATKINLWRQFGTIYLGLVCGDERERKITRAFLGELRMRMIYAGEHEGFRQIIEFLDEYYMKMESLRRLREAAMLRGKSGLKRPALERINRYETVVAIVATVISVIIAILARVSF